MPASRNRTKVLIVDDERDLVLPIALRLASLERFEVETAYDGLEGFKKAIEFRPDIAVIDLAMPVLDGWTLCRRLKEDPRTRGARVIIMTAWLSPDLGKRAKEEGIAALLLKPFEETDLIKSLDAEIFAVQGEGK